MCVVFLMDLQQQLPLNTHFLPHFILYLLCSKTLRNTPTAGFVFYSHLMVHFIFMKKKTWFLYFMEILIIINVRSVGSIQLFGDVQIRNLRRFPTLPLTQWAGTQSSHIQINIASQLSCTLLTVRLWKSQACSLIVKYVSST